MSEVSQEKRGTSGAGRKFSSAQEALLAEVLGDVLVLSDEVKTLKAALPGAAKDIEASGQKAASIVNNQVVKSVGEIRAETARLEAQQFSQAFKEETEKTLKAFHQHVTMAAPARWKYRLAVGLLAQGLLCAIAGATITYFVTTSAMSEEQKAGEQILKAIPKLDPVTKASLLAVMNGKNP
ncbi:MAG: hypothetical protein CTY12_01960 [Methylotenera sp.]|nr:MAG: hypothetical protein CTY12_01960 [Methylotenera sp.]